MTIARASLAAAAALTFAPPPAAAHPHIFVDAEVAFEVDGAGTLQALSVTWAFDEFYTMLLLMELGVDPAAPPDAAARDAVAALQPGWAADFGGDGALAVGGVDAPLEAAEDARATVEGGALRIVFRRPLARPVAMAGLEADAVVYDPSFFVAYALTGTPVVTGEGAAACAARLQPFDPDADMQVLQGSLLELGPDETPAQPDVGRLFADRAVLTCE